MLIEIKLKGHLEARWSVFTNQNPFKCRPVSIDNTGATTKEVYWFANEGTFLSLLKKECAVEIISQCPNEDAMIELLNLCSPKNQTISEIERAWAELVSA
jgi:hypothetical protein